MVEFESNFYVGLKKHCLSEDYNDSGRVLDGCTMPKYMLPLT